VPVAVTATTGGSSTRAADPPEPRHTTRATKSTVRDREPIRVTVADTSTTSPARTGARNCTSEYDANRPSSPSRRMHTSVATSPNRPSAYAPSTRFPA
jgi:hypothetical protein